MVDNKANIEENWAPYLTSIALSTIGGAIIGGVNGGVIGFSSSILDEYLIKNNVISKHYISSYLFWASSVFTPAASVISCDYPNVKLPLYTVSLIVPAVMSYFTNDFLNFNLKLGLPVDAFLTVNKLFDPKEIISKKEFNKIYNKLYADPFEAGRIIIEDIKEIYHNEFSSNFLTINFITLIKIVVKFSFEGYFLRKFTPSNFIPDLLGIDGMSNNFDNFYKAAKYIIALYSIKSFIDALADFKLNSLYQDQYNLIVEKSTEIIIEDGNGRKILAADQGKEIVQNLTYDLYKLTFFGSNKLNNITEECTKSLLSLQNIISSLPDALAPYFLTLIPLQMILENLALKSKIISEEVGEIETKKWEIKFDIAENIEAINLRDGEEFVKYQYSSSFKKENILNKELEYLGILKTQIYNVLEIWNLCIDVYYFGTKVIYKNFDDLLQIPNIKSSISEVYSFLSSNLNFQIDNKDLLISKDRIDKLFEIINTPNNSNLHRAYNHDNQIIIKNYSVNFEDKEIVKAEDIKFNMGKHYAITGKSGSGKTTTLIDLKEGIYEPVKTQGAFSLPYINGELPKVMFIDQNLYLPKDSTLLESIFFPNNLRLFNEAEIEKLKIAVKELFRELEIDSFINNEAGDEKGLSSRLDSKEFKFSGGQGKKIAIIQAVLSQPDILIMDETFTGLDKKSLIKVQQVLNEYLPEALILTVDHHAIDNNYNNFYDYEVNFDENYIKIIDISSKFHTEIL